MGRPRLAGDDPDVEARRERERERKRLAKSKAAQREAAGPVVEPIVVEPEPVAPPLVEPLHPVIEPVMEPEPAVVEAAELVEPSAPIEPESAPAESVPEVLPVAPVVNDAQAAIDAGAVKKRGRGRPRKGTGPIRPSPEKATKQTASKAADPAGELEKFTERMDDVGKRPHGWLRRQMKEENVAGRPVSALRHLAIKVLETDGLIWAQEVLADPRAKDSDKSKAFDLVAKLGAGYITPDMAAGDDAPELPPPIFELSEGELPGGSGMTEETLGAENPERDERDDTAGPQIVPVKAAAPVGPIPYTGEGAA